MSCNNEMSFFPSNFMIQTSYENDHPKQSPSFAPLLPSCSMPQDLHGFASFIGKQTLEEDYSDDGSQMGEKKRRLNMEQVKALEKTFELGSKLEPERKMQLARALGLQPRQIAIWFQNRRARGKTKQLEKDYDTLKRQFDALRAENDILQTHNQKLQTEIMELKNREQTKSINLNKETEGSCSNRSDNSSDNHRLDISTAPPSLESTITAGHPPPTQTVGRHFFPPSPATTTRMQFLQNSSSGQCMVKEENSISNMLCAMDDHSGFWPWLDQQQYN
ncbi:unnamed protein product [Eruca vesicaria subsp. sativa]|uniref:Homeobox-leucine zipper protein n=1 Tax=Eruca vesicaria subsp. sativa TaxID=29727 RepID=A0ABC8ISE4_ERUVS|nr:unnamed protein product [Eruca vesicaria subsp. sativa]